MIDKYTNLTIMKKLLLLTATLALLGAGCGTNAPRAQQTDTSSNKNLAEQGQKVIEKRYGKEEDYCALFTTASGKYVFTPEDARVFFPAVKEWKITKPYKLTAFECDFSMLDKNSYGRGAKIAISISYLLTYDAFAQFAQNPNDKYTTYQTIPDIGDGAILMINKTEGAYNSLLFKRANKSIGIACRPSPNKKEYFSSLSCDNETIFSIARLIASRLK